MSQKGLFIYIHKIDKEITLKYKYNKAFSSYDL